MYNFIFRQPQYFDGPSIPEFRILKILERAVKQNKVNADRSSLQNPTPPRFYLPFKIKTAVLGPKNQRKLINFVFRGSKQLYSILA